MPYETVERSFCAETEEKKSRFIATLVPYANFDETLSSLRQEHRKANHHVTAFRYMDENDRVVEMARDDGEPSGTSGLPVLKTIIGANLMDVAVIVTRYFGGTKLGTGGLARAYSGASNAVLQSAGFVLWRQFVTFETHVGFERVSEIEALIGKTGTSVLARNFEADGVVFKLKGPRECRDLFNLDDYPA